MTFTTLRLTVLLALLLSLLSACTRHVYGVPEDDWRRMSERERAELILIYQERRLHEERRRASEAQLRAREQEAHRHPYPDLLHLRLSGGSFYVNGRSYRYQQHAFQLKLGETKKLVLVSTEGRSPHRITLWVRYLNGQVMLGDGRRYLRTIDYRDDWQRGDHYRGIALRGAVRLDDIELAVGAQPFVENSRRYNGDAGCHGSECNDVPVVEDDRDHAQGRSEGREHEQEDANRQEQGEIRRPEQVDARQREQAAEKEERQRAREQRQQERAAEKEQRQQEQTAEKEERQRTIEQRQQEQAAEKESRQRAREERRQVRPAGESAAKGRVPLKGAPAQSEAQGGKPEQAKPQRVRTAETEKKRENDAETCIERGRGNGKKRDDLPYCDE